MRAVAERLCFGSFTTAPGNGFSASDVYFDRRKAGTFMRTIAEGL